MNSSRPTSLFQTSCPILLTALMALGAAACQTTSGASTISSQRPGQVDLSNDVTTTVVVVTIYPIDRLVTLRREDGSMFTVAAGPEVRNFDQITVGDELSVRYHESLTATLRPAGEDPTPAKGAFAAGRANRGDKPAGGVGMAATVKVKIASVDRANSIVVFSLSSGEPRTIRAVRPEGREFVQTLKVGDVVQLDYIASMAVAMEKL